MVRFKKLLKKILENRAFPIFYFYNQIANFRDGVKVRVISKHIRQKLLNFKDFQRESDTLYVFGSGASINSLTTSDWSEIKKSDSIGLNFWVLHNYVPNYLMFEPPRDKERQRVLEYNLVKRSRDYERAHIIVKDSQTDSGFVARLAKHLPLRLAIVDRFYGSKIPTIKRSIDIKRRLGFDGNKIFFRRGSVVAAIYFGYKLGYRRIVLLGVDLNNTQYFYEGPEYTKKVVPSTGQLGSMHKTAVGNEDGPGIIDVIKLVNERILLPSGVELLVGNRSSALTACLKVHQFNNLGSV